MRRLRVLLAVLAAFAAATATAAAGETPAPRPAAFDAGPAAPSADPFAVWDGVTQTFPAPAAQNALAESAEFAGGASSPSAPAPSERGLPSEARLGEYSVRDGAANRPAPAPTLSLVNEFVLPDDAPEGLSGIAWRGAEGLAAWDDLYALVEDSAGRLHAATIGIDRRTGAITNATFSPAGAIPGAADLEGVASGRVPVDNPERAVPMVFASDERGPAVWAKPSFDTSGPDWTALPLPEPLRHCRFNRALESLALSADGRILWTANEGPLPEDGPEPTAARGGLVRLHALDAVRLLGEDPDASLASAPGRPSAADAPWWFYPLDPAAGVSFRPLPDPFNGLAELCALPDGRLLALERSYGFVPRPEGGESSGSLITISIYLIDPLHSERGEPVRPPVLAKTLLWRGLTGRANYEGMTLGPELEDGSRALLLVSDGDVTRKGAFAFPWAKRLLALRLRL